MRAALIAGLYLILATPLVYAQRFMFPFVVPRTCLFQALVEVALAIWLSLAIRAPAYRPKRTPLVWAMVALLTILSVSSLAGIDPTRSLWSTQARSLGLIAITHFMALAVILGSIPGFNWQMYVGTSCAVATIVAAGACIQLHYPNLFLHTGGRPGSFFGNPAHLASYLVFHIPLGLWLCNSHFNKRTRMSCLAGTMYLLMTTLMLAAIVSSETRGALLGLSIALASILISITRHKGSYFGLSESRISSIVRVTWVVVVLSTLSVAVTRRADVWKQVPTIRRVVSSIDVGKESDVTPRLIAWKIAWKGFWERPILGYGPENFKYPFDAYFDPALISFGLPETYFDKPHNIFLEYLVCGGLIGLIAYVVLLTSAFWTIRRSQNSTLSITPFAAATLIAYIVQNCFLFDTFGSYLMFALFLGLLQSQSVCERLTEPCHLIKTQLTGSLTTALILISLLPVYFLNFRTLYANHKQYCSVNEFLNGQTQKALVAYHSAINTPNPYRNYSRIDFAEHLPQTFDHGVDVTTLTGIVKEALNELSLAIHEHPNDFLPRMIYADLCAKFEVIVPDLLALADTQIAAAIQASPNRQRLYCTQARLRLIQGKAGDAFSIMKHAVELNTAAADPHYYLGLTAIQAGQIDLGLSEIEYAGALGWTPQSRGEAEMLGALFGNAGRTSNSAAFFNMAATFPPVRH